MARALAAVRAGKTLRLPVAGAGLPPELEEENPLFHVTINEFVPSTINADVGEKVTVDLRGRPQWRLQRPQVLPAVRREEGRDSDVGQTQLRGCQVPGSPRTTRRGGKRGKRAAPGKGDAGKFDGSGGLHSSGMDFDTGDKFSLSFTKPRTYLFACLIHPAMVGKMVVK
ncbi:MAG: hypothetical protein M3P34_07300 [Actinomycetota bacterium]|nr:hypothetical protein [Actinomycetota bacterium]